MKITSLLLSFTLIAASSAEAVLELTAANFDEVLALPQPKLIEFYASWCGHCKNLAPVYEELAQGFRHAKDKVVIAKIDADQHKEIGKRYGIQGFPTLKWMEGDKVDDYKSGRDLDSFASFITEKTGLKMRTGKPPSKIVMLTDQTFNKTVQETKHVFCAFTAPWCGHCKTLAPIWETLAEDFANEPDVVIAKVDAESPDSKKTAELQGIQGFPTIKLFTSGDAEPLLYQGERSESALVEYVNSQAGTFRAPGGGLTAAAGTIAHLDDIIQKYVSAGGSGTYLKDLVTAAKAEAGKYGAYYKKVAEKLQDNSGYAAKELARLQGILKKGALAPEKLDDLVRRSNVLQKFSLKSEEKSEL